jgi:cellulose biosynthesis protein BcsQ
MALANVAALLAKWGQKVLIIDWDLEAPGIEKFFEQWLQGSRQETNGVIDLVKAYKAGTPLDWHSCLLKVTLPQSQTIDLLTAGRDNKKYVPGLRKLHWEELFAKKRFGNYLEALREQWVTKYDFILIDSRTGITDIGGICTIHLPDVLIAFFTANAQSLIGVKDVLQRARSGHRRLPVDRRRLLVIPVPSRDETTNEYQLAETWREKFAKELGEFFEDWMPREEHATTILNYLKIPYFAYWSFGERLPVVEQKDPDNPKTLAYAYQPLAKLILGRLDWQEAHEGARATEEAEKQAVEAARLQLEAAQVAERAQQRAAEQRAMQLQEEERAREVRIRGFVEGRLLRELKDWQLRIRQHSFLAFILLALLVIGTGATVISTVWLLLLYRLASPSTSLPPISPTWTMIPVVSLCGTAIGALLWMWLRPGIRAETARTIVALLSREHALFSSLGPPYNRMERDLAFSLFVERVEGILERGSLYYAARKPLDLVDIADLSEVRQTSGGITPIPSSTEGPPARISPAPKEIEVPVDESPVRGYQCDVYISYHHSPVLDEWVQEFLALLSFWLSEELAREARLFSDNTRQGGDAWEASVNRALVASRCLLAIWTPSYFQSKRCLTEWQTFQRRENQLNTQLVVPVLFHGRANLPEAARRTEMVDFTRFALTGEGFRRTEIYLDFQKGVQQLAKQVADIIQKAPVFSPDFQVVIPEEMR